MSNSGFNRRRIREILPCVLIVGILAGGIFLINKSPGGMDTAQAGEPPVVTEADLSDLQEQYRTTSLVFSDVNAQCGEEIIITANLVNNPGILGMSGVLSFDESILTLTSIENGEALSMLEMSVSDELKSGSVILWDGIEIDENDITDGPAIILHFTVNQNAAIGTTLIKFIPDEDGVVNNELESINLSVQEGRLQVYQ